jgi:hypothetical protein
MHDSAPSTAASSVASERVEFAYGSTLTQPRVVSVQYYAI